MPAAWWGQRCFNLIDKRTIVPRKTTTRITWWQKSSRPKAPGRAEPCRAECGSAKPPSPRPSPPAHAPIAKLTCSQGGGGGRIPSCRFVALPQAKSIGGLVRFARKQLILAWALLATILFCHPTCAQGAAHPKSPTWLLPVPELEADPKIPTLTQVLGYSWAQEISAHADIERYIHAL